MTCGALSVFVLSLCKLGIKSAFRNERNVAHAESSLIWEIDTQA